MSFACIFILPCLLKMCTKDTCGVSVSISPAPPTALFSHTSFGCNLIQTHPVWLLGAQSELLVCSGPSVLFWIHLLYTNTVWGHCSQMYKTPLSYIEIYFGTANQIVQISVYGSPGLIISMLAVLVLCRRGVKDLLQISESIAYSAAMYPM